MIEEVIPNFFIVGVPKAGTTALAHSLAKHPDIFISPIKETDYFSAEEVEKDGLYYEKKPIKSHIEYSNLFTNVENEQIIGEASVSYIFYPSVPLKIKKKSPNAKIVIVLRDPVERAISHYLMDRRLGYIKESLEDLILNPMSNHVAFQQVVLQGLYYENCKNYIETFGSKNVLILEYNKNILSYWNRIEQFLEINSVPSPENSAVNSSVEPKHFFVKKIYQNKRLRDLAKRMIPHILVKKIKSSSFFRIQQEEISIEVSKKLKEYYKEDQIALENYLQKIYG